ncbi:oocyte zinc finger protein XlCOF7.1-like [Corythoichthys intestinalis]|uniref:oocyte zinc finger protein XlCOF7.1-like n=1 Tax=Corythoichthys intestinalis TaxID=161448 RepID=UPI0025A64388|nr:oocyte zinc finger protein XlCOF7.1-like [Corythoichthys intestinalis]
MDVLEEVVVGTDVSKTNLVINSEPSETPMMKFPEAHEDLCCHQCLITFVSQKSKQNHMRRTHPDLYTSQLVEKHTLWSCYNCNGIFHSPEELAIHREAHHQGENRPVCPSCSKVFSNFSRLYRHELLGCGGEWHCRECDVHCHLLLEFHKHCIQEHDCDVVGGGQSGGRRCAVCRRTFRNDEALRKHQERVENARVKPDGEPQSEAPTKRRRIEEDDRERQEEQEKEEKEELKIPCPKEDCNQVFPTLEALRAHKKCHHLSPSSRKKQ